MTACALTTVRPARKIASAAADPRLDAEDAARERVAERLAWVIMLRPVITGMGHACVPTFMTA